MSDTNGNLQWIVKSIWTDHSLSHLDASSLNQPVMTSQVSTVIWTES